MPSRKSNVSIVSNNGATGDEGSPTTTTRAPRESTGMSVEDLSLPRTMISRLAKGVLPPNTQIQKDALSALSKSATVFVNYLASNAMENATGAGKKTIQPPDVIVALRDTEFEFMIPRIEAELKKYNTVQCDKRNSYRRKVKADKLAAAGTGPDSSAEDPTSAATASANAGDGAATTSTATATAEATTTTSSSSASKPKTSSATAKANITNIVNGSSDAEGDDSRPAKKVRRSSADGGEGVDGEDDEGDVDEDEEMEDDDVEEDEEEEEDDVEDEEGENEEGGEDEDPIEDEDERIQRQIERDEALDEADGDDDDDDAGNRSD